jgi:long-chain acyl-CoA synthetase
MNKGAVTVPALLARRVASTPDSIAFRHQGGASEWQPLTWRDFAHGVERHRAGLAAAGVQAGERLGLCAPVSLDWELIHLAALSLGVVVVGLDPHDRPERIAGMVEQADITVFAVADVGVLAELSPERWGRCTLLIPMAAGADTRRPGVRVRHLSELADAAGARPAVATPPAPEALATIIFTSGTSGQPKGIAYSHRQVCLAVMAIVEAFPFVGPGSHLLCWLPLANLFQRIVNLAGMHSGATTYLLPDPRQVMTAIREVDPDVLVAVPRFFEKLLGGMRSAIAAQPAWRRRLVHWAWRVGHEASHRDGSVTALPAGLALRIAVAERLVLRRLRRTLGTRLKAMVSGSAPLAPQIQQAFEALGLPVLEAYGMSENIVPMAMNRLDRRRLGSVGQPVPGQEVVVGTDGLIRVKGPGVFGEYLGETAGARRDPDGFYTTSDLGRFDADGFLYITSRAGDLFKTSTGQKVSPAAIESRLGPVSGIDQVVIVGQGRKCLLAICSRDPAAAPAVDRRATEEAIRRLIHALGEHERPGAVIVLSRSFSMDRQELTPNLKLRRAVIEDHLAETIEAAYGQIDAALRSPSGNDPIFVWRDD